MATMGQGAAQEHRFESPTEALKHEHRVIERALRVLEALAGKEEAASSEQWNTLIDFIRNFADQCHHLKEEKIFFPALEKHGIDATGGPVGIMLEEHEEGRSYVRAMAECLTSEGPRSALIENARSYLRLLQDHIQKEDDILFEMADSVLPPEEKASLLREFEEHEMKEMGAGVHQKYLALLENLEASLPR